MGTITLHPSKLAGLADAPPSKSCAHRAVIAAALAPGRSRISNLDMSQDIDATLGAVKALGATVELHGTNDGRFEVEIAGGEGPTGGVLAPEGLPLIDCRESGSTLRFLLPVSLAASGGAVFTGAGRLGSRSLGPYLDLFAEHGIAVQRSDGGFPMTVRGCLRPGRFTVPGGVSSQFITGLLLAAPQLGGSCEIAVQGVLESLPYVDITIDVMGSFGVDVQEAERGALYRVCAQAYQPADYRVEGDWSQAAFLLLMGLLSGTVAVSGLSPCSRQGDRVILDIFKEMGGDIRWSDGVLTAHPSALAAATVDVSQCPDLTPAIAAAMALARGESRITGGRRLRDKESDRIASITACLCALGAQVTPTEDGMVITGVPALLGGDATSAGDHRIAMMAAAVSAACSGTVKLEGYDAVAKSWPGFWEVYRGLGGRADGQQMG